MREKKYIDKYESEGHGKRLDTIMLKRNERSDRNQLLIDLINDEYGSSVHIMMVRASMGWLTGARISQANITTILEELIGRKIEKHLVGNCICRVRNYTGLELKPPTPKPKKRKQDRSREKSIVEYGTCLVCGYNFQVTEDHPFYCHCPTCAPNGVGYAITTRRPETRHGSRHGAAL